MQPNTPAETDAGKGKPFPVGLFGKILRVVLETLEIMGDTELMCVLQHGFHETHRGKTALGKVQAGESPGRKTCHRSAEEYAAGNEP